MNPDEVMQLTVALPGLTDYSSQEWTGTYDEEKTRSFARAVAERRAGTPLETIGCLPPESALQRIGIHDRNAQRILFGDIRYRVVKYDRDGNPIANDRMCGLYALLQPSFLSEVQEWSRRQQSLASDPYPMKALKEGLANAVAHAAYFDSEGDVTIELFHDQICISNLCVKESQYFANKWFSRSHKTVNRVLMEVLRLAGVVHELGRGKNLIFAESLRHGKKPPEVIVERGGRYNRWRLYIHGGPQNRTQLRLLQRLKEMYADEQKALIANALVLWAGHPVSHIRQYVDGESSRTFADVLADLHGPIFYHEEKDQIIPRRWVRVLVGEGKDSKQFSAAEEQDLFDFVSKMQMQYDHGYITPKQLRDLAAMGHTPSETVLSSEILKKWTKQGKVKKVRKGLYRFVEAKSSLALEKFIDALLSVSLATSDKDRISDTPPV